MTRTREEVMRFAQAIGAVCVTFGVEASVERIDAYTIGLEDVPLELVETACRRAMQECERMPVPAQLRELAGVVRITVDDEALLAWETVQQAVSIGCYRSVDFEDRTINATIRHLGGWPEILAKSSEEFDKWLRKDFLSTYRLLKRVGPSGEMCRPLPGLSEDGMVRRVDGTFGYVSAAEPVLVASVSPACIQALREKQQKLEHMLERIPE